MTRRETLLHRLTDPDAFILFEIAELSMHEVAVTLGCPLKTAYKRLYAARRAIAEQLGEKGGSR